MSYRRIEQAILDSLWAIEPSKLDAICAVVADRIEAGAGARDLSAFEPAVSEEPYTTDGGVRVIPIRGTMAKRMNLMMAISGGVSTEMVQSQFAEAVADPGVRGILLDIDSPGGTVDGSFTLADMVYAARGVKPVVAFGDGSCTSAAYLVASAADRIVTNDSALVGSIGVVTMHVDRTGQDAKAGLKRTIISAGRYKAMGSDAAALDKESAGYLQSRVDATYTLFVDRVARNLGVGAELVLQEMADGRIFLGRESVGIGLVQEIGERGDALRIAGELADHKREVGIMRGTVMQHIDLALAGKSAEVEGEEDRANAEAIVARVREFDAAAHAEAQSGSAACESASAVEAVGPEGAPAAMDAEASAVDGAAIAEAERDRVLGIQGCCEKLGLAASACSDLIASGASLDAAREALIDKAADGSAPIRTGNSGSGIAPAPGSGDGLAKMREAIAAFNAKRG